MRRLPVFLLIAIAAIGLAAPLIAHDRPFALRLEAEGPRYGIPPGWSFPWFGGLFEERTFPSAIDRTANGWLCLSPLLWAAAFLGGKRRVALILLFLAGGPALAGALEHRERRVDYPRAVERARGAGLPVFALFPPVPHGPFRTDVAAVERPPGPGHPLGTDGAGRDVLARMLYGTRTSLSVSIVAVGLSVLVGVTLGAVAGWLRGPIERAILLVIEAVACFPALLLVMVVICLVRDRSLMTLMLVLAATSWPGVARLVRAEFLSHGEREHVLAARALGVRGLTVAWRHVLPHSLTPVFVWAAFGIAGSVLVESGLSFLGLGDPGASSWGQILAEGRETGRLTLLLVPSAALLLTVWSAHGLAELLKERLGARVETVPR